VVTANSLRSLRRKSSLELGYFLTVFFGTFALEDVALATGLAFVAEGKLSVASAFLACFLGISIGDIGLYWLGYLFSKFEIEKRFKFFKKYRSTFSKLKRSQALTYSIVASRLIPGTRLPTYLSAGFLGYSFVKFTILTVLSVFAWVTIAMVAGQSLSYFFMDHLILNLVLFMLFLGALKSLAPKLADRWQRRALLHSWRKWLHFEFWPAFLFYLPIGPIYIYLALKNRSLFAPFYASPHLKNGGLIGESKWDFLKHLNPTDPSTLKALTIDSEIDFMSALNLLKAQGFTYPFIVKPDVGQRGYGVRIVRNDFDLTEYLLLSNSTLIFQKLSVYPREAGIFYIRKPQSETGFIFSITDKLFPTVTGNGISKLGDLILKNTRARIIAPVYLRRLKDQLDEIPAMGQTILLSECGNHCQGAIFKNGENLAAPELLKEIDRLARSLPDFYFGRFDIRYLDPDSLRQGKNFEIVEINGSGSEATHIWDAETTLWAAYKTLYFQWKYLFEIGAALQKSGKIKNKISILGFLKDCAVVFFRKEPLSVSS
jgi:membrane protein DedA with SNARE-associated domain